MKNNTKTILIMSLVGIAVVIAGIALMNTNSTADQKQKGVETSGGLVGKLLPDIRLIDKDSNPYTMENMRGKNVVLFFNEGLMCYPACWNQIAAFGSDERFNSDTTIALSVVVDSPKEWQKAIEKMPELANATTLFDTGASVSRQLGVLTLESSMHVGKLPGHTYVLIDKEGVVREIIDDPTMAINNDKLIEKISAF